MADEWFQAANFSCQTSEPKAPNNKDEMVFCFAITKKILRREPSASGAEHSGTVLYDSFRQFFVLGDSGKH